MENTLFSFIFHFSKKPISLNKKDTQKQKNQNMCAHMYTLIHTLLLTCSLTHSRVQTHVHLAVTPVHIYTYSPFLMHYMHIYRSMSTKNT